MKGPYKDGFNYDTEKKKKHSMIHVIFLWTGRNYFSTNTYRIIRIDLQY